MMVVSNHGSYMLYYYSGNVWLKTNFLNDKEYGLSTLWDDKDKIYKQKYFL